MRHSVAEKPPFPLTLTLSLGARILRTLCAHCAPEPASGPLTPSLSPSEGERAPDLSAVGLAKAEGRERGRFLGREERASRRGKPTGLDCAPRRQRVTLSPGERAGVGPG